MGPESPLFPPTFAPPEDRKDEKPGYVVDEFPEGSIALIDSVGSQANRMEPMFLREPYSELVPQVRVRVGERQLHLLELGHRAADAVVRFSDAWEKFENAFALYRDRGDATSLAKLAPTSIVFGCWDSRGTQVKLPRLVESVIRAHKVKRLTRSAQYIRSLTTEEIEELAGLADSDWLSKNGIQDAPAGRGPGGVVAEGGVVREALLNLVALRALEGSGQEATEALQRYILGLALVAFTAPMELYLRQGCLLVGAGPARLEAVSRDGSRSPFTAGAEEVVSFASASAQAFGVGSGFTATFQTGQIKKALEKDQAKKQKAKETRARKQG
jgi:CRISPR-associated protein Csb1